MFQKQKAARKRLLEILMLAGLTGLEPATSGVTERTRLGHYRDTKSIEAQLEYSFKLELCKLTYKMFIENGENGNHSLRANND